jgi:hypothetical protein
MRTFNHWTLRYIKDRAAVLWYEASQPEHPWLTRAANEIIASFLKPTDIGLEFGSGRSTVWLASRIAHLTSVEHDPGWADQVRSMLREHSITNVDYRLIPADQDENSPSAVDAAYAGVTDLFSARTLDFVLIDGIYRDSCSLRVMDKIRPGGILVIDNVNWYLPGSSHSPNSRRVLDGPKGETWDKVAKRLLGWRKIWTTSGVTDTAIFFRPCE